MQDADIKRINELAQKMRTPEGLTEDEKREQAALRQAYVAAIRGSLKQQLDGAIVVNPDGTEQKLTQKKLEKN